MAVFHNINTFGYTVKLIDYRKPHGVLNHKNWVWFEADVDCKDL